MPVRRRLLIRGLTVGDDRRSRQPTPELGDLHCGILEQHRRAFPAPAKLHLDLAGAERPTSDRDPKRAPEQLGIDELLPWPRVAVVVQRLESELHELAVQLIGIGPLLRAAL